MRRQKVFWQIPGGEEKSSAILSLPRAREYRNELMESLPVGSRIWVSEETPIMLKRGRRQAGREPLDKYLFVSLPASLLEYVRQRGNGRRQSEYIRSLIEGDMTTHTLRSIANGNEEGKGTSP